MMKSHVERERRKIDTRGGRESVRERGKGRERERERKRERERERKKQLNTQTRHHSP